MEIRREERLKKLLQSLKNSDKIHLRDAALFLDVSEMTIRRDLNVKDSPLMLLGGYIVATSNAAAVNNYYIDEQKFKYVNEKRHIGQLAAPLINENEVVFFDSGTTIPFIIENIPDDCCFTGVCYSLNIFLALQNKPKCRLILCGGEFKTSSYIFSSVGGRNELDFICPNKAFISAAGISLNQGLTTFILDEVHMKQKAIAVSQQTILIADHSKFDQVRVGRFADLSMVDLLITDCLPQTQYQDYLKQHCVDVLY